MNVTNEIDTRELVYDCVKSLFLAISDAGNEQNECDIISQVTNAFLKILQPIEIYSTYVNIIFTTHCLAISLILHFITFKRRVKYLNIFRHKLFLAGK